MNSEPDPNPDPGGEWQEPDSLKIHNPVYYYKDSGIQEKHGDIPLWLYAVVVILSIWGLYYLIAFWSAPPA